jgi:vacuolar protein sorting-associated protein IST1
VQRLKTLQEKKEAQAKLARRDVATLLERNKLETSRIKVESRVYLPSLAPRILTRSSLVINDDIYLELLELMELYCELLIARFGMLDQPYVCRQL